MFEKSKNEVVNFYWPYKVRVECYEFMNLGSILCKHGMWNERERCAREENSWISSGSYEERKDSKHRGKNKTVMECKGNFDVDWNARVQYLNSWNEYIEKCLRHKKTGWIKEPKCV